MCIGVYYLSIFLVLRRQVPLVEQEQPILPEHLSAHPVFRRVRVTRSLVLCVCFVDSPVVLILLAIVLSVRRITSFYSPFDIFKLFLEIYM